MSKTNGRRKTRSTPPIRRPRLEVADFRGQWVAIHPKTHKVLGHGSSLEEARQKALGTDKLEPILYFVPKSDAFFVGPAV